MKGHFRGQSLEQWCPWRMTRDRYIWFCYALEVPRYHFPLLVHIRMRINFIIISTGHTVLMEISHGTGCPDSPGRSPNRTYMRNVMFLPEVKMSWNSLYEFFFFSFSFDLILRKSLFFPLNNSKIFNLHASSFHWAFHFFFPANHIILEPFPCFYLLGHSPKNKFEI